MKLWKAIDIKNAFYLCYLHQPRKLSFSVWFEWHKHSKRKIAGIRRLPQFICLPAIEMKFYLRRGKWHSSSAMQRLFQVNYTVVCIRTKQIDWMVYQYPWLHKRHYNYIPFLIQFRYVIAIPLTTFCTQFIHYRLHCVQRFSTSIFRSVGYTQTKRNTIHLAYKLNVLFLFYFTSLCINSTGRGSTSTQHSTHI